MMDWRICVLGAMWLLMAAGCQHAGIQKPADKKNEVAQWVLPEHVDKWLQDNEYGLVLEWIGTLPHNEPGFAAVEQIRAEVGKRASAYEQGVLQDVAKELKQNNSDTVLQLLSTALRKYPDSQVLQQKRQQLFRKQVRQISFLNRQLLIARGEFLLKESHLREELAQLDWDNPAARWNARRISEEVKTTSFELIYCSRQAWREGFQDQAQACIELAGHMHKSKEQEMMADQISRQLAQEKKQKEVQQQKQEETIKVSAEQLQALASRALSQGQLRPALEIIDELLNMDRSNNQYQQLKKAVEEKLALRVSALMKRGNNYYKNGSIEDAKRDWEEVLRLDPDNKEARNNVERATRVLEKLIELQGEESS